MTVKIKWTVVDVADRLEQAAATLKKLPPVRVQGFRAWWPDIVCSAAEAYGWEPARHVRAMPTGKQIDEMDEAMRWLMWLERKEVRLVFLRASGAKWKTISHLMGFSRTKLCENWKSSIIKITLFLNLAARSDSFPYKKLLTASGRNSGVRFGRFGTCSSLSLRTRAHDAEAS